jgi:hypothetical protein
MRLGIEADIILFHPYDRGHWGFDRMAPEADERYLRYVIARLGAFRNVWWSLANEYELMEKSAEDWERYFRIIRENDYGQHLRSIHNSREFYDFGKPWITHCSIRHKDVKLVSDCTKHYGKPVIIDECGYEGNLPARWGSLTAEDTAYQIWEGNARGGYVTHGEAYLHPENVIWWSHGGELRGESIARIAFLKALLDEAPEGVTYSRERHDASTLEIKGEYYLQYFGAHRFSFRNFSLPEENKYKVELIDTWNMTITPQDGTFEGKFRIDLPSKPYYALRIQKV